MKTLKIVLFILYTISTYLLFNKQKYFKKNKNLAFKMMTAWQNLKSDYFLFKFIGVTRVSKVT